MHTRRKQKRYLFVLTRFTQCGILCDMTEVVLLTTAEVARRFRVDTSVVRRWVAGGKLTPAITTPGGHFRFDAASLEQFTA